MPLFCPSEPPLTTDGDDLVRGAAPPPAARSARRPAAAGRRGSLTGSAARTACRRPRCSPGLSPAAMRSVCPGDSVNGWPPSSGPVRIFGPLRSCMTATVPAGRLRRVAHGRIVPGVRLVRSVREVQPEDIDAAGEQRAQRFGRAAGRAEGGNDFCVSHGSWLRLQPEGCVRRSMDSRQLTAFRLKPEATRLISCQDRPRPW